MRAAIDTQTMCNRTAGERWHRQVSGRGIATSPTTDPGCRTHTVQIRNTLLMMALKDEEWVLWWDVDVNVVPPTLLKEYVFFGGG